MNDRQQLKFYKCKDFINSLKDLEKNTVLKPALQKVLALLGRIDAGLDPFADLEVTDNGEGRFKHSVKYKLQGNKARLVTYQSKGQCILLFVGSHEAADVWLDRARGLVPTVDAETNQIKFTHATSDADSSVAASGLSALGLGTLFERLPEELYDMLTEGLPNSKRRAIEALSTASEDSELKSVLGLIPDAELRKAMYDVLTLLRQDRTEAATERARLHLGISQALDSIPEEQLEELTDSEVVRRIEPTSRRFREAIQRLIASGRYKDWMLFLHPDQEKIVDADFAGPATLLGVSGSGKTCVVIRRAVRLAELYEGERVLVVTINRALAQLIQGLVNTCAADDVRANIKCMSLFDVCRDLLLDFEPHNEKALREVTWKHEEPVDAIWQEFYRCEKNNHDARVLRTVHDSLLARGWNAERYVREEIDWLRSALSSMEMEEYITLPRKGRALPLTEPFRRAIIEGTEAWTQKMFDIGAFDTLGLVQRLARYIGRIRPRYRCVLVDEGQDFGNAELDVVRRLVGAAANDLFIAGDAAQAVSTKFQSFKAIGIDVPKQRVMRLALNYRNSRDVLEAAFAVLDANMSEELLDREDFMVLQPQLSSHAGSTPMLLRGDSLADEIASALHYLRERSAGQAEWKGCLAVCGYSLHELQKYGARIGVPVLDGTVEIEDGTVFLSDLEQTKGFEFNSVCIVNCSDQVLPDGAAPDDEKHRDLARFYVAMTRARTELVLSWSGERMSPFVQAAEDHFLKDEWSALVPPSARRARGVPKRLETLRDEGIHLKPWRQLTGDEFLYSAHALGLPAELIAKLRELIDGVGLRKKTQQVKWKTMHAAYEDARRDARTRILWGAETHARFVALGDRLAANELATASRRNSSRNVPDVGSGPRRQG